MNPAIQSSNNPRPRRAIEEDFPIVEINRLAIARRHGIKDAATADKSFDNAPGLIVYKPQDIAVS